MSGQWCQCWLFVRRLNKNYVFVQSSWQILTNPFALRSKHQIEDLLQICYRFVSQWCQASNRFVSIARWVRLEKGWIFLFIRGIEEDTICTLSYNFSIQIVTHYRIWTDNQEGADFESAVFTNFTKWAKNLCRIFSTLLTTLHKSLCQGLKDVWDESIQ